MGVWEDAARERERQLLLYDTLGFLDWIIEQDGKEAHINSVPINFNSFHWASRHPEGPLFEIQTLRTNVFQFAVTEAGKTLMRAHGWTGKSDTPPLDPSKAMVPEAPKPLTSIWVRDGNLRIYEMPISKVRPEISAIMHDNNVAVIDGKLYATSFEDLMGTEEDATLTVQ